MITRGEELTLTAVRYLRRCLLESDIEALIAAQFNPSDYELLEDPTHFIKTAQGQPTARLQITLNWGKAIDLVTLANGQKDADADNRTSDVCRKNGAADWGFGLSAPLSARRRPISRLRQQGSTQASNR